MGPIPAQIASGLVEFTGRDWVRDALDEWAASPKRAIYLTGGPGSGKSLVIAELIQRRRARSGGIASDRMAAWHFCQAADDRSILPGRIFAALASCLTELPGYADALADAEPAAATSITASIDIAGDVAAGAGVTGIEMTLFDASIEQQFDRLIRKPLEKLAGEGKLPEGLVIAIDGLDEALSVGEGDQLVRLLARLVTNDTALPTAVKLLIAGRSDVRITSRISIDTIDLGTDQRSANDIRQYALNRLAPVLDESKATEIASRITELANGVFLYARYVIDDLLFDRKDLVNVSAQELPLPRDLSDFYVQSLNRELTKVAEQWEERYRPILGALAVARSPGFTAFELAGITGLAQSRVDDALKRCSPYLTDSEDGHRQVFHQSFVDYLQTEGDHHCYPSEAHSAVSAYLKSADNDRTQRDLVWHLAAAGDLDALEHWLTPGHLGSLEASCGPLAVAENLQSAAAAAVNARHVLRSLRWAWAATGWRRHTAESLTPELLPLALRTGRLDDALTVMASLPTEDRPEDTVTQLALHLIDLGRCDDALDLIDRAQLRWGPARPLAAVVQHLAREDPAKALDVARTHPDVARQPQVCAALAEVGGGYADAAEAFAGDDPDALCEVAMVFGRKDIDRALTLAERIPSRWERRGGSKVKFSRFTLRADLIAACAQRDPVRAALLLGQHFAVPSRDLDFNRAVVATAVQLGSIDPDTTMSLVELIDYASPFGAQTARGLVVAAASPTPLESPRWQCRCFGTDTHTYDSDLLAGINLEPLRNSEHAREVGLQVLLHAAENAAHYLKELEYPDGAVSVLVAATAMLNPDIALIVLDDLCPGENSEQRRRQARTEVVKVLARSDPSRAFELASNAANPHQAKLVVVDAVASVAPAEAIALIDKVDSKYTVTKVALLGTCARHVAPNDHDTLAKLHARLPQPGESEAFQFPFALAGVALASRLTADHPQLAKRLVSDHEATLRTFPHLRDPYVVAQVRVLARTDLEGALSLARTAASAHVRVLGAIAAIRSIPLPPTAISSAVRRATSAEGGFLGADVQRELANLIVELATSDLTAAIELCAELESNGPLDYAADRLRTHEFARWGETAAVDRLVAAAVSADRSHPGLWRQTGKRILAALFDGQPEAIESLMVNSVTSQNPELGVQMQTWARARSAPLETLESYPNEAVGADGWCDVIERSGHRGAQAALEIFCRAPERTERRWRAILSAMATAAAKDPRGASAAVDSFDSWDGRRSRAFRAVAEGATVSNLAFAVGLLDRIEYDSDRGRVIESIAAVMGTADEALMRSTLRTLMDQAGLLDGDCRADACEAIVKAVSDFHALTPTVVTTTVDFAAKQGDAIFYRCLPHLVCAAHSESKRSEDLVSEFAKVRELVAVRSALGDWC